MQLNSGSVSSPTRARLRKKHKRLDAICESVYNQNHKESKKGKEVVSGSASPPDDDMELRRSSRVRRAPDLLDTSPPPAKKRTKIATNVSLSVDRNRRCGSKRVKEVEEEQQEEEEDETEGLEEGSWRARLRSRGRNVGTGGKAGMGGRRKLFDEIGRVKGETGNKKELADGKLIVVRSKRPERVKAVNDLGKGKKEGGMHNEGGKDVSGKGECVGKDESTSNEMEMVVNECVVNDLGNEKEDAGMLKDGAKDLNGKDECVLKDESTNNEMEVVGNEGEEVSPIFGNEMVGGANSGEAVGGNGGQLRSDKEEEKERLDDLDLEKRLDGNDSVKIVEQSDKKLDELDSGMDGKNKKDPVEVDGALVNDVQEGGCCDEDQGGLLEAVAMPLEAETDAKVDNLKPDSTSSLGRSRIKQGRRCGLCGCGNDGKLPKRLVQAVGESEHEAYSGSSGSEEANYDIWDGFGDEPGWLGRLLGPINDRYGIAGTWVHQHCAVWSPEVYFAGLGRLKNVRAALCRGRVLKCSRCGRPGATIGCRVDRCPKTYHLPCARATGCIFDHRKFLIACTYHRHLFQPHGNKYAMRIKKLKARKMKLEMRKVSNDAWRKDVEAEEKWLENCGEDEEFLKRESKRLHRDLLRIAPVYIGGSDSQSGKLFEGWESVAGLQSVVQCMKEVVILPLLYPEFFSNLGITPPRGVLLHGYPGTGKTLVVRALIGSCARGDKRIAYFARKGADCLGKYVGDAERQLRLLFQVAERCQPSIIFFDEIDGLAPCRTRQQDQTHSSVVSTLLALMDGLKSRGSVVVIGATNRPDAVDPALRRPGRFDREIYFPLPSVEDRAAILSLHTQRWPKPVTGSLLKWIAAKTVGFAGADLQALCTQASITALKRNFPLKEILSAAGEKGLCSKHNPVPAFAVEERDWLEALACAPPPCSRREAGIDAYDLVCSPLPTHLIPCLLQPLSTLLVSLYLHDHLWLPPTLLKAATLIKDVIILSLEKRNLPRDRWWSHVQSFLIEADVAKEMWRRLSCAGILNGEPLCASTDYSTDETDDEGVNFEPSAVRNEEVHTSLFRGMSFASRKKSGFRILIAGSPRSGQRHLASCILHCFVGNVEIQKVDLATVSQEGHGDMVQGITQVLMKCAGFQSCMIFMPRIDLWALETCHQLADEADISSNNHQPSEEKEFCSANNKVVEKENEFSSCQCKKTEMAEPQGAIQCASHAWSSFVEQVESICVSTSLMILATSELPFPELPHKIRQFFKNDFSDSTQPAHLERTVPQFAVHVDGNLNRDEVISLSAAELSRDIIQTFIQLVHQRAHVHTNSSKDYKICGCFDTEHQGKNDGLVENESKTRGPRDHSLKVPPPPAFRSLKGKSSLLLAISTFGYQILRYPHFAELCWVTSKLKDGPCVDICGPWKGWPFNSCIVRPSDSLDKIAVASNSSNVKSKEKFSLVRGLIAVGLSAYRGVYKSLREVSFEVRKVLELLVGQVNEKIQSGKDRYQYVHLLSQVAYLEDLVNSWAYGLQSLELDAQMKVANANLASMEFQNNRLCVDNSVQNLCEENASHESKWTKGSPSRLDHENPKGVELTKEYNGFCCHDCGEGVAHPEHGSTQQIVFCGHTNVDKHYKNSAADNQIADNMVNEQDGIPLRQFEPETTENCAVNCGNSKSLKHYNGFTMIEPGNSSDNVLCNSGEVGASNPVNFCNQSNELAAMEDKVRSDDTEPDCSNNDTNFSPTKTSSLSTDSGVVCSYQCCSECLYALHSVIQKILAHEWELNRSNWKAEDVHDVVASVSLDLLSAVRKVDIGENISNSSDENLTHGNPKRLSYFLDKCHCKSSGNSIVVPMECSCHSLDACVTAKANHSPNSLFGLHPKFVFRDGVLVPVDSNKDVSFHCKYDTLCLCSIIKYDVGFLSCSSLAGASSSRAFVSCRPTKVLFNSSQHVDKLHKLTRTRNSASSLAG